MSLSQMKIHQVFNSSLVSGPETLVMPNLTDFTGTVEIVLIQEYRLPEGSKKVADYVRSLGFKCHEVKVKSRFDIGTGKALAELWKREKPDLIHSHGQKASFYTLMAVKWPFAANRAKLVTTNHSVRINHISKKLQGYEVVYQKLVIPFFNRTLTVCTTDANLLEKNGIPASKIRVHLNGVDRQKVAPENREKTKAEIRAKWKSETGQEIDGVCFGVVARLSQEKRYDRILDAFVKATQAEPSLNMRLVCMGSGPLDKALKDRSRELGISDRVHWLGYRTDAAREMAGLDALLSWSDSEGLPINLIEAGWAGAAVIVHGVDGVNDLVTPESGYVLARPMTVDDGAKSLIAMAKDASLRDKLALSFQERVATKFSKATWVERLDEIYNEIKGA